MDKERKRKWTLEAVKLEAKKYKTRGELQKMNQGAYLAAWRNGWLDKLGLPAHAPAPRESVKWTFEAVKAEVKKHKTQAAFRKHCPSAFQAAWRNGWLAELFPKKRKRVLKK